MGTVRLAPGVITGFVSSTTVTVNDRLVAFPAASVAVKVTGVTPIGKLSPELWSQVIRTPGQLSVALSDGQLTSTLAVVAPGPVSAVSGPGSAVSVGLSSSRTVTVWVALALLAATSVAVHVIVVVPPGNGAERLAPSLRFPASVTPGTLSVAVVPSEPTTAEHRPGSVRTVTSAPTAMTGGSRSSVVTVCVAVCAFPLESVARHVIVVTPTANGAAIASPSLRVPSSVTPGQLSMATVLEPGTCATFSPSSVKAVRPGAVRMTGFSVSLTVTV